MQDQEQEETSVIMIVSTLAPETLVSSSRERLRHVCPRLGAINASTLIPKTPELPLTLLPKASLAGEAELSR